MKLDLQEIKQALLNYDAQSELKQASVIMLQNIFKNAEIKKLQNSANRKTNTHYEDLRNCCNNLLVALNNREAQNRNNRQFENALPN